MRVTFIFLVLFCMWSSVCLGIKVSVDVTIDRIIPNHEHFRGHAYDHQIPKPVKHVQSSDANGEWNSVSDYDFDAALPPPTPPPIVALRARPPVLPVIQAAPTFRRPIPSTTPRATTPTTSATVPTTPLPPTTTPRFSRRPQIPAPTTATTTTPAVRTPATTPSAATPTTVRPPAEALNIIERSKNGNPIASVSPKTLFATQDGYGGSNVRDQLRGIQSNAKKAYPNEPEAVAVRKYLTTVRDPTKPGSQEGLFGRPSENGKSIPVWVDPDGKMHVMDAHHRAMMSLITDVPKVNVEIVNDFRGRTYPNGSPMTQTDFYKQMYRAEKGLFVNEKTAIESRINQLRKQGDKDPLGSALTEYFGGKSNRVLSRLQDNPTRAAMGTVSHENRLNADLFKDYKQFDVGPWLKKEGLSIESIARNIEKRDGIKLNGPLETNPKVVFELRGILLTDKAIKEITGTRVRGGVREGVLNSKIRNLADPNTAAWIEKFGGGVKVEQVAQELRSRGIQIKEPIAQDKNVQTEVKYRVQQEINKNMTKKQMLVTALLKNSKEIYDQEAILRRHGVADELFQTVALNGGKVVGLDKVKASYEQRLSEIKQTNPSEANKLESAWNNWQSGMEKSARLENQALRVPIAE